MQLHTDTGQIRVIIDVTYSSAEEFINFIENEQCQFIDSLGVDGLLKFEWYVDESANSATLIEEFTDIASFQELATKAMETFDNMPILGDVSEEMKENLSVMEPNFKTYKAGLN